MIIPSYILCVGSVAPYQNTSWTVEALKDISSYVWLRTTTLELPDTCVAGATMVEKIR